MQRNLLPMAGITLSLTAMAGSVMAAEWSVVWTKVYNGPGEVALYQAAPA